MGDDPWCSHAFRGSGGDSRVCEDEEGNGELRDAELDDEGRGVLEVDEDSGS